MSFVFGGNKQPQQQTPAPTPAPTPIPKSDAEKRKEQIFAQGRRRGLSTVLGGSTDSTQGTQRKNLLGA
jgi:hypothetical protein